MMFQDPLNAVIAVEAYRGLFCEHRYMASAVLVSQTNDVVSLFPGSEHAFGFLRSSAKPFQVSALLAHPEARQLTAEQWAIAVSSHGGAPMHTNQVLSLLTMAHVSEDALQCGCSLPIDEEAALTTPASALCHNCSGKHAAMLLACHLYGWDKASYLDPKHPLQQYILRTLKEQSGYAQIDIAIDGCGAPVFYMPVWAGAKLYQRLVSDSTWKPIVDAMVWYPELVGDAARLDTNLMRVTQGQLVAKVGAQGVLLVAHRGEQAGLMIKLWEDNNNIRDRLVVNVLWQLGWLTDAQYRMLSQHDKWSTRLYNNQGREVGQYRFRAIEPTTITLPSSQQRPTQVSMEQA